MKALSLYQPWASLVAIGAKRIETRSWPTNYRGPLAIHAAKNCPIEAEEIALAEPFQRALREAGINFDGDEPLCRVVPCGAIVAIVNLTDCRKIPVILPAALVMSDEYYFGDYTAGRYAWEMEGARKLPEPVKATGRQGLWNWEPPESVVRFL